MEWQDVITVAQRFLDTDNDLGLAVNPKPASENELLFLVPLLETPTNDAVLVVDKASGEARWQDAPPPPFIVPGHPLYGLRPVAA